MVLERSEGDKVEEVASPLDIQFVIDQTNQRKAVLQIHFGPHRLSTSVRVDFVRCADPDSLTQVASAVSIPRQSRGL